MQKILIFSFLILTGCASVTPPPDQEYWAETPRHTNCTSNKSGVAGQYAASLLASTLGGLNIGASFASGAFPILGIPLAALGIAGASDVDEKYDQIDKCIKFKEYMASRGTDNQQGATTDTAKKLLKLKDLHNQSLLTDKEYIQAKEQIISQM